MKYKESIVLAYFKECGLPVPELEFRFHPTRKWRFDFLWLEKKVALEVEGGSFSGGAHTRGAHFRKDMEKYNQAALLGYMVLRVVPENLCMQETVSMIQQALGGPQAENEIRPRMA